LLAVDLRTPANYPEGGNFPAKCTFTHSISPLQATALIALCLSRHHKRFTLTAFADGAEESLQIISIPKSATVETIMKSFEEVKLFKNFTA
jgi:hypothetical protein